MAALFRTFYFPNNFLSASNPCSKSAVNVVRTRPRKNSSANQRFLRPVEITNNRILPVSLQGLRKVSPSLLTLVRDRLQDLLGSNATFFLISLVSGI